MGEATHSVDVNTDVRTAYNQWTQFEEFPRFMEGVEEVRQLDDRRLHWRASVAGRTREWEAEIQEQVPDEKIIWRSLTDEGPNGIVQFQPGEDQQTLVHLEMSYEPEGMIEQLGEALNVVERRVEGDLERFKQFIEERPQETGAWRGELENPDAPGGHTRGAGTPTEDLPRA